MCDSYLIKKMAQLLYPTTRHINGPWLISKEDLEELDIIMSTIDIYLQKSLETEAKDLILSDKHNQNLPEQKIKELVDMSKSSYPFNRMNKSFVLKFSNDTKLKDESIKGLLKDNKTKDLKPREFDANIEYGRNNIFKLEIKRSITYDLTYDLQCYDSNMKDEIQYEIDKWLEKRTPSKVLRFWASWGIVFFLFLISALSTLTYETFSKEYFTYNEVLVTESKELLKNGINATNHDKAVELLLKMQSNYQPKDFIAKEKPKDATEYKVLTLIAFITIVAYLRPKTTIGLGKSKAEYAFYKVWIKTITITIPAICIIGPFWDKIIKWLY